MAYLRLIENPGDNVSLMRVINEPKRGIGGKTYAAIEEYANAYGLTVFEAICEPELQAGFGPKIRGAIADFADMISSIRAEQENLTLMDIYDNVLNRSGYLKALKDAGTVEADTRIENIMEFKTVIAEFGKGLADGNVAAVREEMAADRLELMGRGFEADSQTELSAFLEQITLMADIDNHDEDENAVVLMTMHSAKGLEFPVVFIAGFEAGLFPSDRAADSPNGLEEERRLCYVAMTRARKQLYLSCAARRSLYGGMQQSGEPSMFIREIDPSCIRIMRTERGGVLSRSVGSGLVPPDRPKTGVTLHTESNLFLENLKKVTALRPGNRVRHQKFGMGTVVGFVGEGKRVQIKIQFDDDRCRVLLAIVTKLEKVADEA